MKSHNKIVKSQREQLFKRNKNKIIPNFVLYIIYIYFFKSVCAKDFRVQSKGESLAMYFNLKVVLVIYKTEINK